MSLLVRQHERILDLDFPVHPGPKFTIRQLVSLCPELDIKDLLMAFMHFYSFRFFEQLQSTRLLQYNEWSRFFIFNFFYHLDDWPSIRDPCDDPLYRFPLTYRELEVRDRCLQKYEELVSYIPQSQQQQRKIDVTNFDMNAVGPRPDNKNQPSVEVHHH